MRLAQDRTLSATLHDPQPYRSFANSQSVRDVISTPLYQSKDQYRLHRYASNLLCYDYTEHVITVGANHASNDQLGF